MLNVLDLINTNYGTFEVCYMYLKLLLTSYLLDLALSTFTNKMKKKQEIPHCPNNSKTNRKIVE